MIWNLGVTFFLQLTVYVATGTNANLHTYTYPDSNNEFRTSKNIVKDDIWSKKVSIVYHTNIIEI